MVTANAANDILGWAPPVVRTSDKDVSLNTALADDGVLQFDVIGGEIYLYEALLIYSSPVGSASPDFKAAFASSTGTMTGVEVNQSLNQNDVVQAVAVASTGNAVAGTATTKRLAIVRGYLTNTVDATVKLQWAQNISNSNATRLHSGSLIRWKKL